MTNLNVRTVLISVLAILMLSIVISCAGKQSEGRQASNVPRRATADLKALQGSGVHGSLSFIAIPDGGVRIEGLVLGLAPNSKHGFHIHEKGDCSSPDGKSAGGHFNPDADKHGALNVSPSHIGDLSNITADEKGTARISLHRKDATLGEGKSDVSGRGLIIHAGADDLKSQPTGAAGGRIACGVIQAN